MKERQRWQPEEDVLLHAYVNQFGPREWNLISQRMSKSLDRDPKSCFERWKNYLKPGIKKGSLSPQEQTLVISLQEKYGNKWKKIAAEVPGRTAKRLGKWWEVFKEKQIKQQLQKSKKSPLQPPSVTAVSGSCGSPERAVQGTYDHILETFAEKYVQPYLRPSPTPMPNLNSPILSLSSGWGRANPPDPNPAPIVVPPWMNQNHNHSHNNNATSATPSPSVSLTLFPSDPVVVDPVHSDIRFSPVQQMGNLVQYCKEVEEAKQNWIHHKKEATWRLSRLEQLEAEKIRKRRVKTEEIEAKIRCLREEETAALAGMESEFRDQLNALQRDAEGKEVKLMETWSNKQMKLSKVVEQINGGLIQHQHGLNLRNK